jgi:hypothetical protein
MQAYSDEEREDDPHSLPDVEIFYMSKKGMEVIGPDSIWYDPDEQTYRESGWYYWFCFPGCLPDSDAFGPFESAAAAQADAKDQDW